VVKAIPPGAESPVFWGSVAGIVFGAVIAFVDLVFSSGQIAGWPGDETWIVAVFACTVGVRYYASVVFLTYDDILSARIRKLSASDRRAIFASQSVLVLGSNLNISLLTTLGALASAIVILIQSLSTIMYWKPLWRVLIKGPGGNFSLFLALGEIAVGVCAVFVILRHTGVVRDIQGQSILLGMVIMVFLTECFTTYPSSASAFWKRTASYLR
jgi:hypothetical protein